MKLLITAILALGIGALIGSLEQKRYDNAVIISAQQNEMQAAGLEDECKALLKK